MTQHLHSRGMGVTVTDLFCGAGGSSQGVLRAGAEVQMAINHWPLAVETHQTNFPNTTHDCADISQCNPRRYPRSTVLIGSPDCTNQTSAKGVARRKQLADLWGGKPDPAAERSRATMWDIPRFAEYHRYELIIVENVVEARQWVMWPAWLQAMDLLGYDHRCVYFNSMFAYPTPQSRDRLYVVFWRKGNNAPNLDICPPAWCPRCTATVASVQSWKPGRSFGKYKQQYLYCCPTCTTVVEPYYYAAANAIDWSLPVQRIGDRARPLAEATLLRIQAGLDRFAMGHYQPSAAAILTENVPSWVRAALAPQCADEQTAMTYPPFTHSEGAWENVYRAVDAVLPAQTTSRSNYLTFPFVMQAAHTGENTGRFRRADNILPTQHTSNAVGVVAVPLPPCMVYLRKHSTPHDLGDPLMTVEAGANHHMLVDLGGHTIAPFTVAYNGTDDRAHSLDDALGTQPTHDRHAVVAPLAVERPHLEDCGYRMLAPHEVQRGMAFADDYVVLGNQRDKIRQLGGAVTPPVMEILSRRGLATLGG